MIDEVKACELAKQLGFSNAAFMDVKDLVIKPEYRKYCEMNLCHQYDANPACPPKCGTVQEMTEKVALYRRALVLQIEVEGEFKDAALAKKTKAENNRLTDELLKKLPEEESAQVLRMSAGPWHQHSCMSAYCVDAQCMADAVHMTCWADDGKGRYFSMILFK